MENFVFRVTCAFIAMVVIPGCNTQERRKQVFPDKAWIASAPEKQGIDADKLRNAIEFLKENCHEDGVSELLIVRNGYVIFKGEHADSFHSIWSCSKTFTSAVLGLLTDEKVISPDDLASKYEPLLAEKYPEVTFRHFATMTSGYSAAGKTRWPGDNNDDWSWTVYEPETPLFAPGTQFAYWDEAQMMFGRVLTQVLQGSMYDYLRRKITGYIDMEWTWKTEKDLHGIPINNGCTDVITNAGNLARWGWLFLNDGNWNGRQLISREWIKAATSVQVPASVHLADTERKDIAGPGYYGFNWWINAAGPNGKMKLPGAPGGIYFASGANNNKCFVIPEWNMVIVRMGQDGNLKDNDTVYGKFIALVSESILD